MFNFFLCTYTIDSKDEFEPYRKYSKMSFQIALFNHPSIMSFHSSPD